MNTNFLDNNKSNRNNFDLSRNEINEILEFSNDNSFSKKLDYSIFKMNDTLKLNKNNPKENLKTNDINLNVKSYTNDKSYNEKKTMKKNNEKKNRTYKKKYNKEIKKNKLTNLTKEKAIEGPSDLNNDNNKNYMRYSLRESTLKARMKKDDTSIIINEKTPTTEINIENIDVDKMEISRSEENLNLQKVVNDYLPLNFNKKKTKKILKNNSNNKKNKHNKKEIAINNITPKSNTNTDTNSATNNNIMNNNSTKIKTNFNTHTHTNTTTNAIINTNHNTNTNINIDTNTNNNTNANSNTTNNNININNKTIVTDLCKENVDSVDLSFLLNDEELNIKTRKKILEQYYNKELNKPKKKRGRPLKKAKVTENTSTLLNNKNLKVQGNCNNDDSIKIGNKKKNKNKENKKSKTNYSSIKSCKRNEKSIKKVDKTNDINIESVKTVPNGKNTKKRKIKSTDTSNNNDLVVKFKKRKTENNSVQQTYSDQLPIIKLINNDYNKENILENAVKITSLVNVEKNVKFDDIRNNNNMNNQVKNVKSILYNEIFGSDNLSSFDGNN